MLSYEDRIRAVKLYIKLGKHSWSDYSPVGLPNQELAD
jgi:hypothetical protein